eukprot:6657691-Alexandrium_andersonii.AAC.1
MFEHIALPIVCQRVVPCRACAFWFKVARAEATLGQLCSEDWVHGQACVRAKPPTPRLWK